MILNQWLKPRNCIPIEVKCRDHPVYHVISSLGERVGEKASFGTKNKATASLTTPSKTHLFLHSCRLDLWEFPRFWISGLKPLYSFFTLFATRGNINQFFAGICMVLWSHVFCFFFRGVFATKRPAESTGWHRCCVSTSMFICTRCVASNMFVCTRITQLRSIQDVCRF